MELWQQTNPSSRYGKTAEGKQVEFWGEDERMFQAHGYLPSLWDDYELPHPILMTLERRAGKWRMKSLAPAEDMPFWCDNPVAQWTACAKLKPGMKTYHPKAPSVVRHLVRKDDSQTRVGCTYWIVQVDSDTGLYPETSACYRDDYQYLAI